MGVKLTPFSKIPIPDKDAARDVPFSLTQIGAAIDDKLLMFATNAVDRDAKFSNLPIGRFVISQTDGTVWVKASSPTTFPPVWGTVWQPTTTVTWYNITMQSGFATAGYSNTPQVAKIGSFVYMKGSFGTSTSSAIPNGSVWGTLPANIPAPDVYTPFPVGTSDPSLVNQISVEPSGQMRFWTTNSPWWCALYGICYFVG